MNRNVITLTVWVYVAVLCLGGWARGEVPAQGRSARLEAARAIQWARAHCGDLDYAKTGIIDNFPAGKYKCNKFVSDAYTKGAGVSYPNYGGSTAYPWVSNQMANKQLNPAHVPVVSGPMQTGDVLAFFNPRGLGHMALYVGDGRMISARGARGVVVEKLTGKMSTPIVRRYTGLSTKKGR